MTKFIQLRNKLSTNILTDSQLKNTKGRGRGMSREVVMDFEPVSITPSAPTSSFPSTSNPKQGGGRNTPKGPPEFGPGGPSHMGPIV